MTAPDDTMRAWLLDVEATAKRLNQWAIDGCPGEPRPPTTYAQQAAEGAAS